MVEAREFGTDAVMEKVTGQVNVITTEGTERIEGLPEHMRQVAHQVQEWVQATRERAAAGGNLINRETYKTSDDVFDQMRTARYITASDDVVSNALEMTEGLAFQGVKWESSDHLTQDVFNQMAAEQNLDEFVRKAWRELFTCSQVTVALWWREGKFKVRGETESGNRRKSTRKVWYPSKITLLDSARVVPVGSLHFGMERLAWVPEKHELDKYDAMLNGKFKDDLMDRFYAAKYEPEAWEAVEIAGQRKPGAPKPIGTKTNGTLILLNEESVSRHTLTRPDFERWAPVRLASLFPLIDMKQQLMAADRVALVGAANYILLVKKGDKDAPGRQEEIDHLKENFKVIAKIPVIFSDHRLSIEIITPAQDYTLDHGKYDMIDVRILQRLMNGLPGASMRDGQDGAISLGRTVSRALEGRRHMLKRYLERILARAVIEHPSNAGIFDEGPPSLTYFPANITLTSDAQLGQQILSLRTQKELSRETVLEWFGFDQEIEAMRRQFEEKKFDDIFQTQVPFSATGAPGQGAPPAAQGPAGNQGGRPAGGGKPSQNPTKTNVTDKGTTSPDRSGS